MKDRCTIFAHASFLLSIKYVILRTMALSILGFAASVNASVLLEDNFEDSLGNWSAKENASLYSYPGKGINFATSGNGAAAVEASWDQGVLTMNKTLMLNSIQASSVTISFDYEWNETRATRYVCIDYSNDGGRTWTDDIGDISSWGSFTGMMTLGKFSKTLEEKTVGSFTDNFKFRIRGKTGGQPVSAYIDNIEIIGTDIIAGPTTKDDIPEPSTFALVILVSAMAALRRRPRE